MYNKNVLPNITFYSVVFATKFSLNFVKCGYTANFDHWSKSVTLAFKQTINKNGNKIFGKKIFQLSLIILLIISLKYFY